MAMAEPLTDMDDHIHKSLSEALAGIDNCHKCGLGDTRTNVVPGAGNPRAKVMFIGEAPGRNEDEQGLPFVGRSGQLLDQYLKAIHLDREKNVFITNIVKCRPPENRDPLPNEWDA